LLCVLETTKAAYDVEAECSGYVMHLVNKHEEVLINQPLAVIAPTVQEAQNNKLAHEVKVRRQESEQHRQTKATKKAQDLAAEHEIILEDVIPSSAGIVRELDVIAFINKSDSLRKPKLHLDIEENLTPVAVYGAGSGGVTIQEALALGDCYQAVCFVDDDRDHVLSLAELPVFHSSELSELIIKGIHHIATEIMRGTIRQKIKKQVEELGFELINVIHPSASVSPSVKMGVGNYIKAGSIIETNTVIGDCCIIDNGAVVAHDNLIGNGCHIAPGAILGSSINLEENIVVGIGACISTNVRIGRNCIISVGASVVQDVKPNSVVGGVPGKVIGETK